MKIKNIRAKKWVNVSVDMNTTGADLKPGDLYVAQRNNDIGWLLLRCKRVDLDRGWVVPDECEYLFDLHECYKVIK